MLDKRLKDRKIRTLSYEDIRHYQKIVVAFSETHRLMVQIDNVIPRNGRLGEVAPAGLRDPTPTPADQ